MATLDDESLIQTLDSENMLQSIADLPDQIDAAWFHSRTFSLPTHYIQSTNVVILGIGESVIGGLIATALAERVSRKPVVVVDSAMLPAYVDSHTLVIGISYSGRTAETVSAFAEAARRGAKLIGLSTGGELGALCRKYRAPHFVIQYGAQSRAAIGYLTIPIVAILERLNFVVLGSMDDSMSSLSLRVRSAINKYVPNIPASQNTAKQLASTLVGKLPLLVGSTVTRPILRRWQMQLQQNAKTLVLVDELPGGLYTSVDGFTFPGSLAEQLQILQIRSAGDDQLAATAHNAYHAFAKKRRLAVDEVIAAECDTLLEELFILLVLGDYVSYYLALLGGVDPSSTPNMIETLQLRSIETGTIA